MKARCRSCDAPILWAKTPGGKPIPLDPNPHASGNLVLVRRQGEPTALGVRDPDFARFVGEGAPLRVSHFATCPNADAHRKGGKQGDLFAE